MFPAPELPRQHGDEPTTKKIISKLVNVNYSKSALIESIHWISNDFVLV